MNYSYINIYSKRKPKNDSFSSGANWIIKWTCVIISKWIYYVLVDRIHAHWTCITCAMRISYPPPSQTPPAIQQYKSEAYRLDLCQIQVFTCRFVVVVVVVLYLPTFPRKKQAHTWSSKNRNQKTKLKETNAKKRNTQFIEFIYVRNLLEFMCDVCAFGIRIYIDAITVTGI